MRSIVINDHWVETQIKAFCKIRRSSFMVDCPLKAISPDYEAWRDCAQCVSNKLICTETSFFGSYDLCNLQKCLQVSLRNVDWLLHLSGKRYRDHASHQLFVSVLGWFLLNCVVDSKISDGKEQTLKQWIADHGNPSLRVEEVELAWWIMGLLHDHAYPLSHVLRMPISLAGGKARGDFLEQIWALLGQGSERYCANGAIAGVYSDTLLRDLYQVVLLDSDEKRRVAIYKKLTEYLSPFFPETQELPREDDKGNQLSCYDHGILGAANLAAWSPEAAHNNHILQTVIRAVAIHNGAACHKNVNAQKDPLAFLLILCDELQEWGRRILVEDGIVCESQKIRLENLEKVKPGTYKLTDELAVIFEYLPRILKKTGWDFSQFERSKEIAFKRLYIPNGFPIKKITYQIPHLDPTRSIDFKKIQESTSDLATRS